MPKRWIGVVVGSDKVTVVDAEIPSTGPIVIQADYSWPLHQGERPSAYSVMHQQVADYAREHKIAQAIIKASAVSLAGTKKAHLEAAELRGVVMCALGGVTATKTETKAHISKTFGTRKVDEYLKDDDFWSRQIAGARLRAGSREAAMVLLAARKAK